MRSGQEAKLFLIYERARRKVRLWLAQVLGQQNRIGIQFQTDDGAVTDYNQVVKPRAWMSITVTKREFLEQQRAANPGALAIYRPFPDHDWADDPEGRAEEYVKRLQRECADVWDLFDAFVDNNEYVFPSNPEERIEAADRYMARFIELCATLGKKAVVLNAATGNWSDDITRFHRMLAALKEHGGFIGVHEYDWPTMWRAHEQGLAEGNEGMWQCLRWKRMARAIRAAYDGWCPQFIITECGLERKVTGGDHGGFRIYSDDLAVAVENYLKSLRWYYDNLDDDVFAVLIFGCGMVAPWDRWGFDIKGTVIPAEIKLFPVTEPPEPPPEPNGGDEMEVKVFDLEQKERGFEYAKSKYGVAFRRAKVAPGQKVYRLVELWEKTGHSSLITQVLNEDGSPMANVDMAFHWVDAPGEAGAHSNDWHKNFVHGPTNQNGDVGPGMGPGAYHGEGEGGPHAVWVRDPNIPTDICEKLGMLASTNHDHLDQKFQLMVEGEEPEPPGGELVPEYVKTIEQPHGSTMLGSAVIAESDAEKTWVIDTRALLTGPGVHDIVDPVEWTYPATGERCSLAEGCCDYGGLEGEEREYLGSVIRLPDTETALIGPHKLKVKPVDQEQKRRVVHIYRLVEKPGPEPSPPPPPEGEPAARLRQIGDTLRADLYTLAAQLEAGQVTGGMLTLTLSDGRQAQFTVAPTIQAQSLRRLWVAVKSYLGRG